ncbi:hypothetical protein [Burkholderia vietnamiensis]|uniref:hypothetical protein n=1 Tax=Burkholderia vietnamiensis TaxID=60552 RepID=UPI0018DE1EF4|nr:hypothetical protein [Burkholderia vietnamiensis]MBH9645086.1 hypothetical protein [Burkholderia vietnamiensis]
MPNDNVLTEPRDAIARSKRILALVDEYHDNPTRDTRTALRVALMDEFQPEPRAEVTDDDKLCASRYRWLSRQSVATHSRDDLNCRWEVDYVLYGESFDAAIDAARTGASS